MTQELENNHNHHQILAKLSETLALLNYEIGQTANNEKADTDARKHESNKKTIATYNSNISVVSGVVASVLPALAAFHGAITARDSIFSAVSRVHEPLHNITNVHYQGKQQLFGTSAETDAGYSQELGNAMDKTDDVVRRLLEINKKVQDNHWETMITAVRNS